MSPTKLPKKFNESRVALLHAAIAETIPQAYSFLNDYGNFRELRVYLRSDGDFLAVAKGFAPDGTPTICFGSGSDALSCLLAVDGTIAAGNWRIDKPRED